MIEWKKAPGGKRYTATVPAGRVEIVKRNTAAGGPRWLATLENSNGTRRVLAKGDNFQAVKTQAETVLSDRVVYRPSGRDFARDSVKHALRNPDVNPHARS